ncbi:alpha-N-acetylgalactosaminidase [Contarinia nasturtii]|uniref:alpha-N-acetylgalactosaminidase n=1 Tax=Contarinia nasturtii TaxID=265458 RepID=UPI0012D37EDA|nr:alpha-N-acetylgalactosaminidase [Contarinia nasturtii]XP_031629997.1 alpha-N-acetylgalactosaminidase [Contarinia nasturtii]XP_031629998.1 alpha-N-acetylgalactosaminidase [Contarinia nasturtii]
MWSTIYIGLAIICLQYSNVNALDNGLALRPPMGWMSWQRYRCITDCDTYPDECISEWLFKNATDRIVEDGYKKAGYKYVIIDDCWMEMERDPNTKELVPDRKRFPSGMKALADYVHSKGLKFGIYEDYGTHTCMGYPGVINHMELDAKTFAKWDVDYVKLDGCYADIHDMDKGYPEFGRLLNATGRPMVYSCSWPVYQEEKGLMPNYEALKKHCNLWRNWDDIQDSYESLNKISDYFAVNASRIQPHAGPGHWNDPDMLLIGNYGLTVDQSESQMAIWAILAAPLLMSNDLKNIRPEFREILINPQVIAVNQDELGIQGKRLKVERKIETWVRPITPVVNGLHSYAVAWASKRDDGSPYATKVKLSDLGLTSAKGYKITDLFNEENVLNDVYNVNHNISIRINPSGVIFYKFTPAE